mgnify:CR=1 FL=1
MFLGIISDGKTALMELPLMDRILHVFWLLGPFILLIERSPADIWLSILVKFLEKTGPLQRLKLKLPPAFKMKLIRSRILLCVLIALTSSTLPLKLMISKTKFVFSFFEILNI